jgi:hypothetical protein
MLGAGGAALGDRPERRRTATGFSEKMMSNKNIDDDSDLPILIQNHD